MLDKIINWVGKRAFGLVTVLALIVAGNVIWQIYLHKTTPLLAWKGGGFGMYTEPHAEDRGVWLRLTGASGAEALVQLWPETAAFASWRDTAGVRGGAYLNGLTRSAERLRFYPRDRVGDPFISRLSRVRWPQTLINTVTPSDGNVFAPSTISLEVYENRYNQTEATVARSLVYQRTGGETGQ
ncbi:hypothetical protein [Neptunicoccus cionae]|uniref:Uncharacterized protein n=1 Tax=Neptunicoccus cionae TaxID=2035344 RepID=A0A916QZH7_9RHOB|nr:hypothetical protein [Amylibacter cionae]GGA23545.1 hypothetical protein GCM10011498_25540 [Amylibacter cionae]